MSLIDSLLRWPLLLATGRRVAVDGISMAPALSPGERVLCDRFAYRRSPPARGDIVLARHPERPGLRIVKRVAAVPGDSVAVADGRCWVNGAPAFGFAAPQPDGLTPRTLADGEYLLLGDSPDASTDGRHFGPVDRDAILAKARLVYWPPGRVRAVSDKIPPESQPRRRKRTMPDAVTAAPDVYKPLFENDTVRVLDARLRPGEKTVMHSHPNHLFYAFTSGRARFHGGDGEAVDLDIETGQVGWMEAADHSTENIGSEDIHVLIVEMK